MKLIGLLEKAYYVLHRRRNVVAALRERLSAGGRVLDFGGGTGRVSEALSREVSGFYVVADVDPGSVHLVSAHLHAVRIAARPPLPFADRCFGHIVLVDVLHHVGAAVDMLRDLVRCLGPRGSLLIVEMDARRRITRMFRRMVRLDGRRCRFWEPARLAAALEDHGLHVRVHRLDALRFLVEAVRE